MHKRSKIFTIVLFISIFSVILIGCSGQSAEVVAPEQNQQDSQELDEANEQGNELDGNVDSEGNGDVNGAEGQSQEVADQTPQFVSPYHFEYPDAVRGIFVTSHSAGGSRMQSLIELVNTTDLNAMVIDIKDDHGYITFPLEDDHPLKKYSKRNIADIHGLMKTLEENEIYPIARIVVFKDSVISVDKPEWSFLENGQVWKNRRNEAFVNPFLKEVWEYNVEIAKMAAELGFQEIQFDYVRFPEGFETRDDILEYSKGHYEGTNPTRLYDLKEAYERDIVTYQQKLVEYRELQHTKEAEVNRAITEKLLAERELQSEQAAATTNEAAIEAAKAKVTQTTSRLKELEAELAEAKKQLQNLENNEPKQPELNAKQKDVQLRVDSVTDFVAYAYEQLQPYGVDVSVDIFGYTATLPEAPGIGQNFTRISEHVDVICSMIYPSHWGFNYFGIPRPDLEPYRLVKEYIIRENEVLAAMDNPPISRPWIQDFTASYLGAGNFKVYGAKEVEDQIRALNENGVWEYLLWNAGNRYSPGTNYLPIGNPPPAQR
ncbi:putative glycoside hydrolase [Desulfuribacillus alkaliarsenatis]|uniref:putative glycoside hydrolase n=1 Tax=Desulfuribacillus alkaliarsenatis TaxID=766136 RepID=UPI00159F139A|nr:putative glycoside hydrolase [Desulfuribacillus alkaliarsenatis]